ncbi:MAG: carboxypeptidase-like regulatory domain-containing protein [Bacteroidales bacterium]
MKKTGLIIFLLFVVMTAFSDEPEKRYNWHVKNAALPEFCELIFKQSGIRVYYHDKWVEKIFITLDADSLSPDQALVKALAGTNLKVNKWNYDLVIIPGETIYHTLPSYNITNVKVDTVGEKAKVITESEEKYITGRKADVTQKIYVGKQGSVNRYTKAKILGRIIDQESGEPLIGAAIYFTETKSGAVTDVNGYFTISLKPGSYDIRVEYIGYEKKKYLLVVYGEGNFSIQLKRSVIQMKEVVVYGDRQMIMQAKDPGLDKISLKSIRELPMMMGERDILRVSGMLPGILTAGEGSAGLNVRGGGSDQNAFYINKIPIYNTSHLFGFFPAFNSDIIKDFSIYKGHIPAQYGGRLSSVFNIITRQGNRKRFTAHGGISPIAGNIVLEGPLKKDTCSVILSARSTYSDWILERVKDPDIRKSSAGFNDFSGGINFDTQKNQWSLFMYHSNDHFSLADISRFNYSNTGASLSFNHNFNNAMRGEFSFTGSSYSFSTDNRQEISTAYTHAYTLGHYEFRSDFKQMLRDNNWLEYGAGFILYKLDRGTVNPYDEQSFRTAVALGKEQGVETALYISDVWDMLPWLNLTLGIRYAAFSPLGPQTVYSYLPGNPLDTRYITDTLIFGSKRSIKWYHEPDARVAVNIETDENGSLKLAFNQMHQNLFMLNSATTIAPNAQWKLADYHLSPSKSRQFSLGIFRTFANIGVEVSVEGYYKKIYNSPEFKDGADFLNNPLVETSILMGQGNAYGLEFFIKRSRRRIEGWISYTYSRSKTQVNGDFAWDKINEGEAYPANHDIPHSLNLVMNYHISRRFTLSSIVTYQSGKPITYPSSVYYINGIPYLDYSKRNAYRIPDYFRTDFSATIEGNLRKNKLIHSSLILSLYNAFGRENPYSVYFKTEQGKIKSYQYSVIGVPIFTVTWLFKLGNYASD